MKTTEHSDAINAPESDYLYLGISQLPNAGNGLFTAIQIYKGERVSVFKGEILSLAAAMLRAANGNDRYFINLPDGKILDSMNVTCFAKYANDVNASK